MPTSERLFSSVDVPDVVFHPHLRAKFLVAMAALERPLSLMNHLLVPAKIRIIGTPVLTIGALDEFVVAFYTQMNAVDVHLKALFARTVRSTAVTNEAAVFFTAVLEEQIFSVKFVSTNDALEIGILFVRVRLSDVLCEFLIGLGYCRA